MGVGWGGDGDGGGGVQNFDKTSSLNMTVSEET